MLHVRDIMTTDVVTLSPDTTLRDAAELLAARHVGGAPVVDGGTVVGVLSASDVLTFEASTPLASEAGGREASEAWDELPGWDADAPPTPFFRDEPADATWSALPEPPGASMAGPSGSVESTRDPLAEHTVAEAMTRRVFALRPTADVSAAADRMRSLGIHRVLVMEGGTLLGVVTTMDLARAVADHRITARTFVADTAREEREVVEAGERISSGELDEDREAARVQAAVDERGEPLGDEDVETLAEDV